MKAFYGKLPTILLILVLFVLIFPVLQTSFRFCKIDPLKGAISVPDQKNISIEKWFSGEYQLADEDYLNETFGFRSVFVRINNQIAFTFFNKAKANGVIIGKKNYLFEENYIKAYYGTDFIGKDSIRKRMSKLKFIQDTLSKLNKDLIIVFAAGKGSFYPEYFPDKFKTKKSITNYEEHLILAEKLGLNYIDFNKYFIDQKDNSPFPLYPQYGIHWSYYGMCLATDSLIKYIENERGIDMPNIYWDSIVIDDPKDTDYDIADGMNLKFKLNSFKMAYPIVKFESDSGKQKPSVLVISDSFYWGIFDLGLTRVFSKNHFWFYNKQIYPESFQTPLETTQLKIREQILKHDVIIIMATEATLPKLGWGFIERAYAMYTDTLFEEIIEEVVQPIVKDSIDQLRSIIRADRDWMKSIEEKAAKRKISVDSMLTLDAIWIIEHQNN